MQIVDSTKLTELRQKTFRISENHSIRNKNEAVRFVNERGFVFFWPIQNVNLPSLWTAVAGDRPVANEHDDPGHITWRWKDNLLSKKDLYYGRVLARKNCMISLELLPFFYALSPNFGDVENEYLDDYRKGTLSHEAKTIYSLLLEKGRMDTISLRRSAKMNGGGAESKFNKALEDLQGMFRIIPLGISDAGRWHYSYIYGVFHHKFPEAIQIATTISEENARQKIIMTYAESIGSFNEAELRRLFHWNTNFSAKTLNNLIASGQLFAGKTEDRKPVNYFFLPKLLKTS